jgi:hypothetical protein
VLNEGTLEVKVGVENSPTGDGLDVCADAVRLTLEQAMPLHALVVDDVGNVGIGTATPTKKLHVDGDVYVRKSIDCYDITVRNPAGGADFVFEENYNLLSLTQLQTFIEENGHLPDIPSAAAMQADGISVPKMITKHLQKIEELTLYMIDLKSDNTKLQSENKDLRAMVQLLEDRLSNLESHTLTIAEMNN